MKQFFAQHKKYGSKDRKNISHCCFQFYRLGKALQDAGVIEKIELASFLTTNTPTPLLNAFNPAWNEHASFSFTEKLALAHRSFSAEDIYPYSQQLSAGITAEALGNSMLAQPDVFVRVRPGKMAAVLQQLQQQGLPFQQEEKNALRLENGLPIQQHFALNKDMVVQDLSSQQVGNIIAQVFAQHSFTPRHIWDCCAASGGKSIMLHDLYPTLQLTVSDIRSSILNNLSVRFQEAGIKKYQSFIADLSAANPNIPSTTKYDLLVADVPCTGSGTWARSPEQLYFFNEKEIAVYASRQFAIAKNALEKLQPGGWFMYITCSVFKAENEALVEKIMQTNTNLQLVHSQLINGTALKADSMFVAIMRLRKT